MPETFTSGQQATMARLGRGDFDPVWLVEIRTLAKCYLEVTDYTQAIAGDEIHIAADGTDPWATLTAGGGGFALGSSNAEQAQNIAAAGVTGALRAVAEGSMVLFLARQGVDDLTVSRADSSGWDTTPGANWLPQPGSFKFVSGPTPYLGYDPLLQEVSPIGIKFDPRTRVPSIAQLTLDFEDDPKIRQLIRHTVLRNKLVLVWLGDREAAEADFLPAGQWVVVDHNTDGTSADMTDEQTYRQGTRISIPVRDYVSFVLDQKKLIPNSNFVGNIAPKHPLELLEFLHQWGEVPTDLYDATTMDPSDASHAAWSHWAVGALNFEDDYQVPTGGPLVEMKASGAINDIPSVGSMVDALRPCMPGWHGPAASGVWGYRNLDPANDSVVRTWDRGIFKPKPPRGYSKNAINYVTGKYLGGISSANAVKEYIDGDLASQFLLATDFDASGTQPEGRMPGTIDLSRFANGFGYLRGTNTVAGVALLESDGPTTSIEIEWTGINPFAGGRYDGELSGNNTIPSWAALNASTRYAYLLFEAKEGERYFINSGAGSTYPAAREVIECDLVGVDEHRAYQEGLIGGLLYPRLSYRISAREQLNTSVAANSGWGAGTRVTDVTMLVYMIAELIQRQRFGMPIIEGWTALDQYDVRWGELLKIPHSSYANYRDVDGGDDAVFQVVGKRLLKDRIDWILAFARRDTYTFVNVDREIPVVELEPVVISPAEYYYDASGIDYYDASLLKYWKVF